MTTSATMILAVRTLLERALRDEGTIEDALAEVERLAPVGGSGRFVLVVDLKDGRRAWVQALALETFRATTHVGRKSFDLKEARPE